MMRQVLNDGNMKQRYKKALEKHAYFLPFMEQCVEEGNVKRLKLNIYFFKQDMMGDMLQEMTADGISYAYTNVSHFFECYLTPKVDDKCE
jgi:hypothetical protein